jgi:hypothetical protein
MHEERVQTLRRMRHVIVGLPCAEVLRIVLSRRIERRQRGRQLLTIGVRLNRRCLAVRGVERKRRRTGERCAHQHHRGKDVRSGQRTIGCHGRAEVVPDQHCRAPISQRRNQSEGVARHIQDTEGRERGVIAVHPTGGAAKTPLVGRHDMVPGVSQNRDQVSPAVSQIRKAVQKQRERPARGFVTGLENMDIEAVDPMDHARADPLGKRLLAIR